MHIEELFEQFDKQAYYRSFDGRIRKMWETASRRTRDKGHKGQMISQEKFFELASNSKEYRQLYKQWEDSGFATRLTPTLDRRDATKGYLPDNLQFLTYSSNVIKGNQEWKKTPWKARMISIELSNGEKVKKFDSVTAAADFLNVNKSTVTRAVYTRKTINGWSISQLH